MSVGDAFLRTFHSERPGCTSAALAHGLGDDGRSSYARMADIACDSGGRVLDLGCGDGYLLARIARRRGGAGRLVGVDMCLAELAAARRRPELEGAGLACGHGGRLPLASASVDCVVSHLAFMLMSDVDRVVAELARVLVPGGVFAAVVGGGPRAGDAFELFLDTFRPVYAASDVRVPRLGDMRARTDAGLASLFCRDTGFAGPPIVEDFYLHLDGTPQRVWDCLESTYELAALSEQERSGLESEFLQRAQRLQRADGTVPCTMALRQVLCRTVGAGVPH